MKRPRLISVAAALSAIGLHLLPPTLLAQSGQQTSIGVGTLWVPFTEPAVKQELVEDIVDSLKEAIRFPIKRDAVLERELAQLVQDTAINVEALKEASTRLAAGKRAYLGLKFHEAKRELRAARKLFIENLDKLDDNANLLETHLYMALTHLAEKNDRASANEFKQLLSLDPEYEMPSSLLSPEAQKVYDDVQQEFFESEKSGLYVVSTPKAADLYVNGRLRGKTPIKIALPRGKHFLRLRLTGFNDWHKLVELKRPSVNVNRKLEPQNLQERLADLFRPATKELPADRIFVKELEEYCAKLGVDIVLLGEFGEDGSRWLRLQWFDRRTKDFSAPTIIRTKGDMKRLGGRLPTAVRNLKAQLTPNGFIRPDPSLRMRIARPRQAPSSLPPALQPPQPPQQQKPTTHISPSKPWYSKWWVWTILGVAAGGVTLGVVLSSGDDSRIFVDNGGNVP